MKPQKSSQAPAKKWHQDKNVLFTIFLVIVLAVIGYFAFTSWRDKTQLVQTVNTNSADGRLPTSGDGEPIKRPTLEQGQPDWISIPERSIETPIIFIEENNEGVYQEALTRGVVHYPGTALPGEPGNPYIFGHSSDFFWKSGDYKEIFKPLVDIPLDTEIRTTNSEGELFIFKVIETKIVGPKDVSVLDQHDYERVLLTLQTSWPIGTALKRYIVIAELDEEATYGS